MPEPTRVLHYGLGPIGVRIAQVVASRPDLESVGAVDIDPAKTGKDLGEVAEIGRMLGIPVQQNLEAALKKSKPDIVLHATGSHLPSVLPQFLGLAEAGLSVISTCEELSYPWFHHPDEAKKIDEAARRNRVAILSTGINPGFIMDTLVVILSGVCPSVTRVRVRRVVDLSIRRRQLQQKVGVNLTPEEFATRKAAGGLGHVGLPESVAMIAAGLEWKLERIEQTLDPVIAPCALESALGLVAAGRVQGQHQIARGYVAGQERITLELKMALQAPDAGDFIDLEGPESVSSAIRGVQGDIATAAIVVNAIPRVLAAAPGLHTMLDMPPLRSLGI
ncbi:MAG: dihydrodipicolinate reductase [Chloroflexi bacterium]|nr:dihydrodipicolinate reductase [Chloroflexota bacterium]